MGNNLKAMIAYENELRKERLKINCQGIEVMLYLVLGFAVFTSVMVGFCTDVGKWEFSVVWPYVLMNYFALSKIYIEPVLYVKEKGRNKAVLEKYINIPVNLKLLCGAKMIVMGRKIVKYTMLGQIAAVIVRYLDGADFSYMGMLLSPFYLCIILLAFCTVCLGYQYKKYVTN